MKAQEKNLIFNLLKTASDNFYGYTSPDFMEKPEFKDDKEFYTDEKNKNLNLEETEKAKITETTNSPQRQNEIPAQNAQTEKSEKIEPDENSTSHGMTIEILNKKILECSKCRLSQKRTHIVPGQGVEHPDVLVIGEGPGEEEDKQGLPFVGPAGKLLDKMLNAIQLDRFVNCYIANTVKCRPPYNRDPQKDEAETCRSFLDAQIAVFKPKMILAVGKVAVRNLLKIEGEFSLNRYRGKIYEYNKIPLIVTYHPSALLRNIEFKKPAWEDLKFFKSKLITLSPDYAKDFQPK
ncbi:MAG: uracil-DNA glycosylase [Treponema sp.]|nr:uracil-DNA glycosylase [Treponema sp.]